MAIATLTVRHHIPISFFSKPYSQMDSCSHKLIFHVYPRFWELRNMFASAGCPPVWVAEFASPRRSWCWKNVEKNHWKMALYSFKKNCWFWDSIWFYTSFHAVIRHQFWFGVHRNGLWLPVGLVIYRFVRGSTWFIPILDCRSEKQCLNWWVRYPFVESHAPSQEILVDFQLQGKVWRSATTSIRVWRTCVFPKDPWNSERVGSIASGSLVGSLVKCLESL